ncbi:hypothetical protein [Hymenobacter metallicola]|uniref:Uncharacterized protein n=1 Tax=Hymenobacter metallicola TaxID=2563114 RepID=A0A4Z0QAV4_9BACT|nr:hypothetical protein [Hymenobacter metallicola]TGE26509.1 hypothetical protein E5K02_17095 [Hymenobacter metallicola]
MKSILNTVLPAMALLTLGGCASTSALTSTESDGVYYSSKDRTTYNEPARSTAAVQSEASEATAPDAEANPDYTSSSKSSSSSQSGGSEYYDDDYSYSARIRRFHQPVYRSFGYGYNDFIYSDPFWYGGSAYSYYGGYSPYGWGPGYYGSFYDPFYGPYYGGSAVVINIGFGRPYYNPWRYGYGYGGYGRGYYDGYRNGLYSGYGGGYYGGTVGGTVRNVRYGNRTGRSAEAVSANRSAGSGAGRSRSGREGGIVAPVDNVSNATGISPGTGSSTTNPTWNGRGRSQAGSAGTTGSGSVPTSRDGVAGEQPVRKSAIFENEGGSRVTPRGQDAAGQSGTTESNGRRWRVVENANDGGSRQQSTAPSFAEQRRARLREMTSEQQNSGGQNGGGQVEQPVRRQRVYDAPQQSPQRSYEAPQRSYEAPTRSYSEPSRSSSPSNGGGGGGGRSGGGRGRGE